LKLNFVSEPKFLKKSVSIANYDPLSSRIMLTTEKGKLNSYGYILNSKKHLFEEETLYLIDVRSLILYKNNEILNFQESFAVLCKSQFDIDRYFCYFYLKSLGYVVRRFDLDAHLKRKSDSQIKKKSATTKANTSVENNQIIENEPKKMKLDKDAIEVQIDTKNEEDNDIEKNEENKILKTRSWWPAFDQKREEIFPKVQFIDPPKFVSEIPKIFQTIPSTTEKKN